MRRTYWQDLPHVMHTQEYEELDKGEPWRKAFTDWILTQDVKSVLDAGCCTGLTRYLLRKAGWKGWYVGMDSNRRALDIANRRSEGDGRCVFMEGDLAELEHHGVDCVYLKDVIEHEDDPWPTLGGCVLAAQKFLVLSFYLPLSETEPLYRTCDGGGGLTYQENHHSRPAIDKFLFHNGFVLSGILYAQADIVENRKPEVLLFKRRGLPRSPSDGGGEAKVSGA